MNTAIIVAAGSGSRFGGTVPKQFIEVLGKPILIHTLERFEKCDLVDEIVLVLSAEEIPEFSKVIKDHDLTKIRKLIGGGKTRAESVYLGLLSVDAETAHIIAVHDGARPLVTIPEISKTIEKAAETGAACLVSEVTDTIKEISSGKIVKTIDRRHLRRALTPQCFQFEILFQSFASNEIAENVTDECYLVEKSGFQIEAVEGSSRNIKITRAEDLLLAETFLREFEDK